MTHAHTLNSITGYRLIVTSGTAPYEFARYAANEYAEVGYDHQAEWQAGSTAVVENLYACGCWSNARFAGERGI